MRTEWPGPWNRHLRCSTLCPVIALTAAAGLFGFQRRISAFQRRRLLRTAPFSPLSRLFVFTFRLKPVCNARNLQGPCGVANTRGGDFLTAPRGSKMDYLIQQLIKIGKKP